MFKIILLSIGLASFAIPNAQAMKRRVIQAVDAEITADSHNTLKPLISKPKTWHSSRLYKKTTQDAVRPLISSGQYADALKLTQTYNMLKKDNRPLFNQKESRAVLKQLNQEAHYKQVGINNLTTRPTHKYAFLPFVTGLLAYSPVYQAFDHPLMTMSLFFTHCIGTGCLAEYALLKKDQHDLNTLITLQKELGQKECSIQ